MPSHSRLVSNLDVDVTVGELALNVNGLFQQRDDGVSRLLLNIKPFPQYRGVDLLTRRLVTSV